VLFVLAWLVTFNKAVVNGDDINHLQGHYGNAIFLPQFGPGWIPNRVVDLYGRNLLGRVFDTLFFPAHALLGVDFFYFYKLFNATVFALFLCVVQKYLMTRIAAASGRQADLLTGLLVALAVMVILPWTNEVRAVCYEVPGFIGFVLLAEIFALMQGAGPDGESAKAGLPSAWLSPLGFVAAFSLEGDAAIILAALAVAWALAAKRRKRDFWRRDVTYISALTGCFCLAALFITVAFSARAVVSENFVPLREFAAYFFAHGAPPDALSCQYAEFFGAGVAGLAAMFWRRGQFAALCGFAEAPAGLPLARWMGCFVLMAVVSVLVTSLLCMETDQDFFSFRSYPWGGLLLMAMFFAVPAVVAPLAAAFEGHFAADSARKFAMLLLMSWMAVAVTGQAQSGYDESVRVQAAYEAALARQAPVVDSGLALDAVEMQRRPLPTASSPGWFVQGYEALFEKYYGVRTVAVFR